MALFVFAALLLIVTSVFGASALKLASPVSFLLASYLFAVAQVVLLTEVLSQFDAVDRAGYLAGQGIFAFIAIVVWLRRGRPRPPRPNIELDAARRHPLLVVLGVAVGLSLLYGAALGVATPPSNWDSMTYHLSRVAAWHQAGAVDYVATHTERQNSFPPNAEIEILYTVAFVGRDTLAAAPQFLALLALLVSISGVSRRVGFGRPSALFAAFVFASLTLVALQSVTTQNDLVVASFVVAAAYFIVDRRCLPLAGMAVGLAIGTKTTALLALPILALLALVVLREWRPRAQLAAFALAGAVFFGVYGYALNVAETGSPLGTRTETDEIRPEIGPAVTASTVGRILFRFADLSGYRVKVAWLEPFENAGEAAFELLALPVNPPGSTATDFNFAVNVVSNEDISFYGPLGLLLFLPLAGGFTVAWVLRRTRASRGILAVALPITIVELALASAYNPWIGRLLVPAVALVAPLAAWVYGRRILTGVVTLLAVATLVYAHLYNDAKPVGLGDTESVWTIDRPEAQSLTRKKMVAAIRAVDSSVPMNGAIGAVLGTDDWSYPLFGPDLERTVVYLSGPDSLGTAEGLGLRWVAVGEGVPPIAERSGWTAASLGESGWTLFEFVATGETTG